MISLQSRQILIILSIIFNSFLLSQDCTELNPEDYGDCATPLGYIWYNNNCVYINVIGHNWTTLPVEIQI